jgi:hypothetical protein
MTVVLVVGNTAVTLVLKKNLNLALNQKKSQSLEEEDLKIYQSQGR